MVNRQDTKGLKETPDLPCSIFLKIFLGVLCALVVKFF